MNKFNVSGGRSRWIFISKPFHTKYPVDSFWELQNKTRKNKRLIRYVILNKKINVYLITIPKHWNSSFEVGDEIELKEI